MSVGEPTDEKLVQDYVSKWYQKRYSGTGFLYHSEIVEKMLEGARFHNAKTSDKILDVGCGIGFVSQLYPNFDITGMDISDGMLARNPHRWIKAPVEEIPFTEGTFDFVICRSLLHHLEEPPKGLAEMYRVLKKGGKWVCWDPNYTGFSEIFRMVARHTPRFSHIHKNFKDTELIGMIRSAGFSIAEVSYLGFLAYPLVGFPDILDLKIPISIAKIVMRVDRVLGKSFMKRMAWSLMIKATK